MVVAGLLGRFPLSMLGLGVVLLISGITGSYGLAGAVSAAIPAAEAVAAPAVGTLSDRRGQRPVLFTMLLLHVVGVSALVTAVLLDAPSWTFFPPAVLAGLALPPIGSFVRARWSRLVGGTTQLNTAFSLESVFDEVVFVIGPMLATVLASMVWAPAGVITATVLAVTGGAWLATQGRTQPPPVGRTQRRGTSAMRVAGLWAVVLVFVAVGATFGTTEVSMVAFAQEHGSKARAGLLLGVFAVGSLISGLLYGTVQWVRSLAYRLVVALAGLAGGMGLVALAPNIPLMALAVFGAGFAIAPTIIAGMGLVQQLVSKDAQTEGFAWVSAGIGAGFAVGAFLAGHVIDAYSGHRAFLVGLISVVVGFLVSVASIRVLRPSAATADTECPPA